MSSGAEPLAPSMAAIGAQRNPEPASPAQARARYFNSANAFNVKLPEVPAHRFARPTGRGGLAPNGASALHPCDQSAALGTPYPATTPFMLARYVCIAPGDVLDLGFVASAVIGFVIAGDGEVNCGTERFSWQTRDVFLLPAGGARLAAGKAGAVLWVVTDEPLFAHLAASPAAPVRPVHFPGAQIEREIERIHRSVPDAGTSGMAVVFSLDGREESRNLMADLTLSWNTLPPRSGQAPHRHNSAAVTLVVSGERCHSTIDGEVHAWEPWSTLVTPPGAAHSHHNAGERRADFLIVQDGGLYYQGRTMGFAFLGD